MAFIENLIAQLKQASELGEVYYEDSPANRQLPCTIILDDTASYKHYNGGNGVSGRSETEHARFEVLCFAATPLLARDQGDAFLAAFDALPRELGQAPDLSVVENRVVRSYYADKEGDSNSYYRSYSITISFREVSS